ncbi:CLIP-associating protein isoform X9 [Hermetia illucens]|uniref:CLIP-associating protein isoform X9 n=1 Tax=Hermetia illucens TaxID=343691 RepID=UPI0018CC7BBE|nr:CLIP-associating protein isoform X9 [Hermetia illucens]
MAYRKPSDLDGFITLMDKPDMRVRAMLAEDLVTFLTDEENSIVCMDLGMLIDGLLPWMNGSHYKIAQKALESYTELIKRLGPDFNAYTATLLPHVIDRLGDSKDTVREKAQLLLHNLMESKVLTPQQLIDKLTTCFKHKNAKVREEFLQTIVNTLNEYGTSQLSLKAYIQPIVNLLSDPTATVRDAAIQTLVEIYKHVGDRLRADLRKKEVPAARMAILEQKFECVKDEGLLLKSALVSNTHDEPDTTAPQRPTRLVKRTVSAASRKTQMSDVVSSTDAGAVTWDIFEASFELVPQITIFNQRDIEDYWKNIIPSIGDKNMDWEKRVEALKKIRSLLMNNAQTQPSFPLYLKDLSIAFLDILKELRSQVIREACITLAYMSKLLRNKFDQFSIYIFQELINLIQNSAKVIASSGTIALKYVIKYTHAPKLIPIITNNLTQSKSKDIRATLSEIMLLIFEEWASKSMDRHANVLKDALTKGIADADSDARKYSRRAFWSFRRHFPDLADQMYSTLNPATQRALERERDLLSEANGTGSMNTSLRGSNTSLNSVSGGVITRAKKIASTSATPQTASPEHRPSTSRGSRAGVSQSQPASRSTSPSAKLREMYGSYTSYRQTGTVPKKTSGIPRSLANSRETSPTRGGLKRGMYANSPRRPDRPPINPARPVLAQKILQQSREAESALADALSPDDGDISSDYSRLSLNRRISRDESDESEASSVCSERSFDSYRRGNDSYSWNGSRNRLDSFRAPIEDIDTIIQFCASTHWSERKDGLISLTQYLSDGKVLTPQQLQAVLDLFRKMFMDSHTKVYALFLDTVNELILVHSNDLHDWLFILLTRLFNKLGTELLGSMHGKIWKTLQIVHEYFPAELQLQCVFRILVDAAQTPPTKTKIAILKFLTNLATTYCPATCFKSQAPADRAITKIIQFANDQKSAELRGQARSCIIALYNCNTPNMTILLSVLPKTYQDTARTIIQQHLRRSTSGNNSPSSPLSSSSPKPLLSPQQGPFSLQNNSSPRSRQSSVEHGDPMNTEEVYKSLRKTTAEIQNYTFETKLDRDANSKDSGISQMGDHVGQGDQLPIIPSNGINGHIGLEKEDSCNGSKTQSATTTESNTPENTVRLDTMEIQCNKITSYSTRHIQPNYSFADNGELVLESGTKESDIIKAAIVLTLETRPEIIHQTLQELRCCIKVGNCDLPNKNFKAIMKMLLSLLESPVPEVLISSLHVLGRILRSEKMKPYWSNFLELILLKIIDCYKNSKEASREIDSIIPRIAAVLPLDITINILNPVIATGQYPSNLCAVKLLTDIVAKQGAELSDAHLDGLMVNLARLTDDTQSMVRKAAVFCIVKLYVVLGEERVKKIFTLLNPSKIRLLNVYIDKEKGKKPTS